jgi:putative hydrolase of the HAD superfamily
MKPQEAQVKTVLFDLGGTLVTITNSQIPHVMKRILHHCGIRRSLDEITHAWQEAEKDLDFQDLTRLLDAFWVEWNRRILENLQLESDDHALARFIATHWWDYSDVSLYPDAEAVLPLLKEKGLKIGLITNGLQSDVDEILPKVNLQNFFDIVVVIDTLRKMKPDAEVFHYALQKLKTPPSNAIFIGDRLEEDYQGAQRAGLVAYLLDREGKVKDTRVNKISSLHDLIRVC